MTEYTLMSIQDNITMVRVEMANGEMTESFFTEPLNLNDPFVVTLQTEGAREASVDGGTPFIRPPGYFALDDDNDDGVGQVHLSIARGRSVHWCVNGSGIRDFVISKVDATRTQTVDFNAGDVLFVCGGAFDADGVEIGEAHHVTFARDRTLIVTSNRALGFRLVPR